MHINWFQRENFTSGGEQGYSKCNGDRNYKEIYTLSDQSTNSVRIQMQLGLCKNIKLQPKRKLEEKEIQGLGKYQQK